MCHGETIGESAREDKNIFIRDKVALCLHHKVFSLFRFDLNLNFVVIHDLRVLYEGGPAKRERIKLAAPVE
jgi:hypothetical protein